MKVKLALVCAALTAGGSERVMSTLANALSKKNELEIHLILLTDQEIFYKISDRVVLHAPDFDYRSYSRLSFTLRTFFYLRTKLKQVKPEALLCFGGRYNSLAILASRGLSIRSYVSERSRPGISYGKILDALNAVTYRLCTGIIAQTSVGADYLYKKTKHDNIHVIGNPVPRIENEIDNREKVILNVGRFIKSKHQDELIRIFAKAQPQFEATWKLIFLGDGEHFTACKELVQELGLSDRVFFEGNVNDIVDYYKSAEIFAFTSHSEGFPNGLAEAMAAGCACISYNCHAGPADLIDNGENGFLVKQGNLEDFSLKLVTLINNASLRTNFKTNGQEKMLQFSKDDICLKYLEVMRKAPSNYELEK